MIDGPCSAIPAVEAVGISKTFDSGSTRRMVLEDVSFSVDSGKTMAVVGESGSGKSTLIRCVAGLDTPTNGRILINGAALKLRSGQISPVQMVFQDPRGALDRMRSVGSSVAEPMRVRSRAERRERVGDLLSMVGISASRAKERPAAFSGGQLQRIVIARALAANPEVLLCDEPTSALDASVQAQIINLLLTLQEKQGFACVTVTHDLAVANALADEVLVLRHGRALFHGPMRRLLNPIERYERYVDSLVRAARDSVLDVAPVTRPGRVRNRKVPPRT